jgi:hypothetical protein
MKKMTTTLTCLSFFFLSSCNPENNNQRSILVTTTPASIAGDYLVILRPLNNHLAGWIPNGKSELKIDDKTLSIKSWIDDSSAVTHRQFILKGSRCPTLEDDKNKDGVIDIIETVRVSGKILHPLDNNLQVQLGPLDQYPFGNFSYDQEISLKNLEEDLRQPDSNPDDHVIKLTPKEFLSFENKVMIVLGVSEKTLLPDSIQTLDGVSPQLSIPIVCGLIKKNR